MADIYLTKKERTTLYTEGLIYSIVVIAASYFAIYGSLFVKMIPMLFILGIISRCVFDKPKTTLILGTLAVLITGLAVEFKIDLSLILNVMYCGFLIALGLSVGKIIHTLYYSYKYRVFIGYNKKVVVIAGLVFFIVLAIFLNSIVNSNPIQYILAKSKTEKYIVETYGEENYRFESVSYDVKNRGGYTFNVIIGGEELILVHKTLSNIEDINMGKRKEELSKTANMKISLWKEKNNIGDNMLFSAIYSYSKASIYPDILEINMEISLDENSDKDEQISRIADAINKLQTFDEYEDITNIKLNIDGKGMVIKKDRFIETITKEYIENGLEIEYLG